MKTKRSNKRWLPMLLLSMLMAVLFGMSALAAGNVVDMKDEGKGIYSYSEFSGTNTGDVYHKITIPYSGDVIITGNAITSLGSTYSMRVVFCNTKGTELTDAVYVDADREKAILYGVKKGTYYIKTTSNKYYALVAKIEKRTDKGGAKKNKATTIKHKKQIMGVMPAGEKASAADWYKIKMPKNKKLELSISQEGSGAFQFYLYGPSYKKGIRIDTLENASGKYTSIDARTRKTSKIKGGTYYIKVCRPSYDRKANGIYTIKWRAK